MKESSRREFLRGIGVGACFAAGFPAGSVGGSPFEKQEDDRYDVLIKGGRVIDPSENLSAVRDVAITGGKISRVAADIPRSSGRRVISAGGHIVTPGLIDIHVHIYDGVVRFGIPADVVGVAKGVTTLIDGGSAGATTFPGFRKYVVNNAATRVLSLLNISSIGLTHSNELALLSYADVEAAVRTIEDNRDVIVGMKVRMTPNIEGGRDREALALALEACGATGLPLMVHIGGSPSPLSELLRMLRPGDVVTHAYRARGSILDEDGVVLAAAREASERGVFFDIGHGRGNFSFGTAEKIVEQGVFPDVISSDVHEGNAAGPVFGLPTTLSKFLHLGMTLEQVIASATSTPARIFGRSQSLGTLREGAEADVALFRVSEGAFEFIDSAGDQRTGSRLLQPFATFKGGRAYGAITA